MALQLGRHSASHRMCSFWIAARVSRPIEQLAHAAGEVAAGDWDVRTCNATRARRESSVLGAQFQSHDGASSSKPARAPGAERACGRLARTCPAPGARAQESALFPLQLTVENLVRARELTAAEFDEVFRESTATLGDGDCQPQDDHWAFLAISAKCQNRSWSALRPQRFVWRVALLHFPNLVRGLQRRQVCAEIDDLAENILLLC
jgi:hypothetical protein